MDDYLFFYRALLSFVLVTALTALAKRGGALTNGALALAWALALVIAFCGGLGGLISLAAVFFCTVLAGKVNRRAAAPIEERLHAKTGPRDAAQIFCNVFTGALMLLLRSLTGQDCFLWAYGGAMAASLADSLASELGVLSKRAPVDILTRKPAEAGLSGAVSPLGLGMSALGAAIVAGVCTFLWDEGSLAMFLAVTAAGFLAALADSALGSAVQAKYRCSACGALTEKTEHCGVPGILERGSALVTNDTVNFCNNLIGALVALGCYFLLYS